MLTMNINDDPSDSQYYGKDPSTNGERGESKIADQAQVLMFTQSNKAFLIRTNDSRVIQVETPVNSNAAFKSVGG